SWQGSVTGDHAFSTAILEEGMKWHQLGMTNEDAQFLETRKYQANEIARIFRIPPHMIGDLERATFSNIEHQSLEFVIHTLRPWLVRWERAIWRDLIDEPDQDKVFAEFLVDGLLRGDAKARSEALRVQFQNGALSIDEWRSIENRNPLPDELGQRHYVQMNLAEVTDEEPEPEPEPAPLPPPVPQPALPEPEESSRAMFAPLIADVAARIATREVGALGKRASKAETDADMFDEWVDTFYDGHAAYVVKAVSP
ncbi:unnamed protein product, partial [marine sediment metagenome]